MASNSYEITDETYDKINAEFDKGGKYKAAILSFLDKETRTAFLAAKKQAIEDSFIPADRQLAKNLEFILNQASAKLAKEMHTEMEDFLAKFHHVMNSFGKTNSADDGSGDCRKTVAPQDHFNPNPILKEHPGKKIVYVDFKQLPYSEGPSFTGENENPEDFISSVVTFIENLGIDKEYYLAVAMSGNMKDVAAEWYAINRPFEDWNFFTSALIKRFTVPIPMIMSRILKIPQGEEPTEQYLEKVRKIMSPMPKNVSSKERLYMIRECLNPRVLVAIKSLGIETFEEAEKRAAAVDRTGKCCIEYCRAVARSQ